MPAIKQAAQSYENVAVEALNDIILTIDDLIPSHDGTFTLRGVKPVQLDHRKIFDVLCEAGVDNVDAERLVDEFADKVFTHQLAKVLAQRTTRVG